MGNIDWQTVEAELKARAVPFLAPPDVFWRRVFVGGYRPEPGVLDIQSKPLTIDDFKDFKDFKKAICGDQEYDEPIDIVWCWDGREQLVRLSVEDLDRFQHSDFSNVTLIDCEKEFHNLLRTAKRALDLRRGWLVPTLYPMSSTDFHDILTFCQQPTTP